MCRIRTLFYCGHESRYGLAHLEPLLKSNVFKVEEIVLATQPRWNRFRSQLTGIPIRNSIWSRRTFQEGLGKILKKVREFSDARIRTTDDVNHPSEIGRAKHYDLAVCAAYPQIFAPDLLAAAKLGAINFHPSYLPRCRGAHPIYWAIASGEPHSGISCHLMEETIDTGPIVAQRRIDFDPGTITYSRLYALVEFETPLLCRDVERFYAEGASPAPQHGVSSYFRNERDADRRINFESDTVVKASAKIRAGGAFAFCNSRRVLLTPPVSISSFSTESGKPIPGHIVEVTDDLIRVSGQMGILTARYSVAFQGDWLQRGLRKLRLLRANRFRPKKGDTLN